MKSKYIKQGIVFIIDALSLPLLITWISNHWAPISDFNDGLQRLISFTAIYEFLAFLINKNQLDARKDSLLIYIKILKQTLLLIANPNFTALKQEIIEKVSSLNNTSYYFIHKDILQALNMLKSDIENNTILDKQALIEADLINAEHNYESESLSWNNTLLLKFFK